MKYDIIPFPFYQNPQFHIMVHYQRDVINVFFKCYKINGKRLKLSKYIIGKLTFERVAKIEFCRNHKPLQLKVALKIIPPGGCVIKFYKSKMLKKYFADMGKWTHAHHTSIHEYFHYIVNSHDGELHVIAKNVIIEQLDARKTMVSWVDE